MGARGRNSHPIHRAPHKNTLANASVRAKEITEASPAWWDLVLGDGRHWPDPKDPEREAAWRKWRWQIVARFPLWYQLGHRPGAWFDFEAPGLAKRKGISAQQLAAMTAEEIIYRLDADAAEVARIEKTWRGNIAHARRGEGEADWREHAVKSWRVPKWFCDQVEREAQ